MSDRASAVGKDWGGFSGCGRKLPPDQLSHISSVVSQESNLEMPQIRGLYQLSDSGQCRLPSTIQPLGKHLVQTLDVVLPLPLEPESWGRIVALHCLSDLYASGAHPLCALGLVESSIELRSGYLEQAYKAAVQTLNEEGAALLGGHSLRGTVDKIGFAVTGMVDSERFCSVALGSPNQELYLTKPIGSGTLMAKAAMSGELDGPALLEPEEWMRKSNSVGAAVVHELGIQCASDVSGFGLLGTCLQIAKGSELSIAIDTSSVPTFDGAIDSIRQGVVSALAESVWQQSLDEVTGIEKFETRLLLADPQVNGGLVLCVPKESVRRLERASESKGLPLWRIGRTSERDGEGLVRLE